MMTMLLVKMMLPAFAAIRQNPTLECNLTRLRFTVERWADTVSKPCRHVIAVPAHLLYSLFNIDSVNLNAESLSAKS